MLQLNDFTPLKKWEGILPKESNEDYHSRTEFLSSSDLKYMEMSPAHFKAYAIDRIGGRESKSMDFGTAVHELFLEGTENSFVMRPDFSPIKEEYVNKKGEISEKVIKTKTAQIEEFEALHPGKIHLTVDEYNRAHMMVGVLNKNPFVREYMEGTLREVSYLYYDQEHDMNCRFRADAINVERGLIIDYKTAVHSSSYGFSKAAARYLYHLSDAHYSIGAERIFNKHFKFILIAQEPTPPFAVGIYTMRKGSRDKARALRSRIMTKIRECKESNVWPDYSGNGTQYLEIPDYAFGEG
jgi:hypothetical protein